MTPAETYEHEGVTVQIHYDDTGGDFANPREYDNVTTLVCWHPDYILGDFQIRGERGAVTTPFRDGDNTFLSMETLRRYIELVMHGRRVTPLYLYDHSGISIRAGSPSPFDSGGWDTTMCGFAYCTDERITELCGDDAKFHTDDWIDDAIREDVATYDLYLTGQVYGYVVDPDGPDEDSCWGFLGDDHVKQEANAVAEYVAKARRAPDRIYVDGMPIEEALYALSTAGGTGRGTR